MSSIFTCILSNSSIFKDFRFSLHYIIKHQIFKSYCYVSLHDLHLPTSLSPNYTKIKMVTRALQAKVGIQGLLDFCLVLNRVINKVTPCLFGSLTSAAKQFLSCVCRRNRSCLMATSDPWQFPLYMQENVPSPIISVGVHTIQ